MTQDEEVGSIHWLDLEEGKILKEELDDNRNLPKYLLPERSLLENEINHLREHYIVPANREDRLDELVFEYERSIAAILAAVERWKTKRGAKRYDVHAMLQLEYPEIIALSETARDLEVACIKLRDFLSKLEVKGKERLPDFMKEWVKMARAARFEESVQNETP